MLDLLKRFYDYNTWATDQLLESLEPLTGEELDLPASGNGSIRESLIHFIETQLQWFTWFKTRQPLTEIMQIKLPKESAQSIDKLREEWRVVDAMTHAYINGLTDDLLKEEVPFTMPNGFSSTMRLDDMVLHIANHGTHTRAQIISALRLNGKTPPQGSDMVRYLLEQIMRG